TRSPASALHGHSLLRDMYGTSTRGKILTVPTVLDSGNFLRFPADPKLTAWSNQLNEYAGCVLTFTTGPLKGTSTRVLYSDKNVFTVMRPQDPRLPGIGTTFVVNGRAFSGFGAGHNAKGTPTPNARQPNLFGNTAGASAYLASGAHENYDAVDYQNMAMAAVIPSEGKV
ncbi:MAG: hypothetical protein GY888_01900, partial [Planctomycetaceae bacterium]|nr:hypothetical protein [Planctomycetaceae bacterium]